MTAHELIESGIIELYCLHIVSKDEEALVEQLAKEYPSVREEIKSVNDALAVFAKASVSASPPAFLKRKILESLSAGNKPGTFLPPLLTSESSVNEWVDYLEKNNFKEPADLVDLVFMELPGTEDYYTYAVYGKHGAVVPDEVHNGHHEHLLICKGECVMTIDGKNISYKAGDYLTIAPGIVHSAVITGNETMIVIGQRRAA